MPEKLNKDIILSLLRQQGLHVLLLIRGEEGHQRRHEVEEVQDRLVYLPLRDLEAGAKRLASGPEPQ